MAILYKIKMRPNRFTSFLHLPSAILLLQIIFKIGFCLDFDKSHFGISLQPYVKKFNNGEDALRERFYTKRTIKAMLTIVSEKFNNVFVPDIFTDHDKYMYPYTYYNGSFINVYSGEMAAEINRDENKNLTLIYNILSSQTRNQAAARSLLAFEAADRANKIFPGTVESICFGDAFPERHQLEQTLQQIQFYRNNASQSGLKLGASLNCLELVYPQSNNDNNSTLHKIHLEIIAKSDFIVCKIYTGQYAEKGAASAFEQISRVLLASRDLIRKINKNAELIGRTEWSSSGVKEWETVENLMIFWQIANDWAQTNGVRVYLSETFDNPWRSDPSRRHLGWWKLKFNDMTGLIEGHSEKISESGKEKGPHEKINTTVWNEATISLAVIVGLILISFLLFFIFSRPEKSAYLSRKEITTFLVGASNQPIEENAIAANAATRVPYDQSLEIKKDDLKIDKTQILGSGEFSFVFKAAVSANGRDVTQVALKIAKENCGSSALRGLLSEIKIMSYLGKHANIVGLLGAYTAQLSVGVVYVATELCELGSLQNYLRKHQSIEEEKPNIRSEIGENLQEMALEGMSKILVTDMVKWSHEIARGMEHLEKKHVVHADLATRNVLLTASKVAKIADFGLSRRMYNYMNYVKEQKDPLPWRWMAVESLKRLEFSSKSDAWSYGITLWEIFSKGDIPYAGLQWTQEFVEELISGLRPKCPQFGSPEIYRIMRECWKLNNAERPDFRQLVGCTEKLLQKCQDDNVGDNPYRIVKEKEVNM